MTLCSTLKYLREDKNLMQKDIAKLLEITPSAYGYYEQDKRQPDPETLRKLADFYNVSTDYLLGRTDFPDPPSNPREIIAPHREGDQFADLPPEAIAEIQMHIDYVRHKYSKKNNEPKKRERRKITFESSFATLLFLSKIRFDANLCLDD